MKFFARISLFFTLLAPLAAWASAPTAQQVESLLEPYFAVQKALAGDDLEAAQAAAKNLLPLVSEGEALAAIRESASKVQDAGSIDAARQAFQPLSQALQAAIESVGTTGKTDVYVAYCPMAFGYSGAKWLQSDDAVLNPYFGSQMLRCGGIESQLVTAAESASAEEAKAANCCMEMKPEAKTEMADSSCCAESGDSCSGNCAEAHG